LVVAVENKLVAAAGEEEEEAMVRNGRREGRFGKNVGWQISGTYLNKECLNLTTNLLKKCCTEALRD
jgi:hypothetical protein